MGVCLNYHEKAEAAKNVATVSCHSERTNFSISEWTSLILLCKPALSSRLETEAFRSLMDVLTQSSSSSSAETSSFHKDIWPFKLSKVSSTLSPTSRYLDIKVRVWCINNHWEQKHCQEYNHLPPVHQFFQMAVDRCSFAHKLLFRLGRRKLSLSC